MTETNAILAFILSLLITFLFVPINIYIAKKFGLIDDPTKNKHPKVIHTSPIPRSGVISIFIGLFLGMIFFIPLDSRIIGIVIGGLILMVTGVLDDKYNINPYLRLVIGFVAVGVPISTGIGISYITNPLGGIIDLSNPKLVIDFFGPHSIWILSDLFALFWITFLMNIVNMGAKGVDGQLSGVVIISSITIALTSLKFGSDPSQMPIIIISMALAGSFLGFLPWHINPQKIMPGYGGSTLAGYLLGILSIMSTTKVGVLIVVLGIPLIDTGYTILRRILQKKSPVWGDRGHLHHRLLDAGFSKNQVAVFYWVSSAILGMLAINLNTLPKLYTMVGITVFVGGLIIWLKNKHF